MTSLRKTFRSVLRVTLAAAGVSLTLSAASQAQSCVSTRFVTSDPGPTMRIRNDCGTPIRYHYCVRTSEPGLRSTKVGHGFVNPDQTGGSTLWLARGVRILDSDLRYCEGAYCAPSRPDC